MDRVCGEAGCERKSCMPEPYRAECARHHMLAIKRAWAEAETRFQAHIATLTARRFL